MRGFNVGLALVFAAAVGAAGCSSGGPREGTSDGAEGRPLGASVGSGGYLLVVNKSSNSLSVVDPETEHEVISFPTGTAPHEVAASSDGRFAYVTDYGTGAEPGSTITVVDLEAGEVTGTIALSPHTRPHGVAVAPDGTLWVTAEGSAHVLQIDPAGGQVLKAVETGQDVTHMVAIAPGGLRVVTANIGSGTATIVDPESGSVSHQVETGAGAEGLAVHPDGMRAYVTNREAGTLVEVDLQMGAVTRSLSVGEFPIRVKVRPGGGEVLVSNANGNEVVAVDLDDWAIVRRLAVGVMPVGILITPDDKTAYVANTQDDRITVIDLENWEISGEIVTGDEPDGMAWVG